MNTPLDPTQFVRDARAAGCPVDQVQNFIRAGILLQPRQLAASAAARLCDHSAGPTAIGYGGARGGGKSHWLLAQIGADDCQRHPGLKCLLLRKSGKTNIESFNDLRQRVLANLSHSFNAASGVLTFENGSRILAKHYQHEKEINDSFLGLEYDVIGVEEATTLTLRKWEDLRTCNRTSKPAWRPRIYSTTNPGGIGHHWYHSLFIVPFQLHQESETRFIQATVRDNPFINPEYEDILASRSGWQKEAWYHGNWEIAAGQFFKTFSYDSHVISHFDDDIGLDWRAAMDFGYTHYTVVLLACHDQHDNLYIVDEHAERGWVPQRHILACKEMFARHRVAAGRHILPPPNPASPMPPAQDPSRLPCRPLIQFVAGPDSFTNQYDGSSIRSHFSDLGVYLRPANPNRAQGWADLLLRLGDPAAGIKPSLFIHQRCRRLIDCLPTLQHDPDLPADVLKFNTNDEGLGGDDAADALRYLVATPIRRIYQRKLCGL